MIKVKAIILAVALTTGMCACSSDALTGEKPQSPGVEGREFSDIPSPPNMALDDFSTYGHTYTAFKDYTLVYRGDLKENYIADFYRNNMPNFGWQMAGDTGKVLTFVKRNEKCVITISSEGTGNNVARIERGLK